ncbi:MAG: FAD:protein FMN transferase, partial [Anaerolineae bacterium]|nr:FAD:protein FMN transferase [Anaerolineae bacterium]
MPKRSFRAMNCEMLAIIEASAVPESDLEPVLASVPQWFETWEQTLSRFRPDSELSRLNMAAKGQFHPISDTLCAVLAAALDAAEDSDGIVSPTVLDCLEHAGYIASFEPISIMTTLPALTIAPNASVTSAPSGWREIMLDRVACEVSLPTNTRIDLGGVAKG